MSLQGSYGISPMERGRGRRGKVLCARGENQVENLENVEKRFREGKKSVFWV